MTNKKTCPTCKCDCATVPSMTLEAGVQVWRMAGVIHRNNGPAVTYPDGEERWYQNGELHRTDGPAVMRPYDSCEWWVNGKQIPQPGLNRRQ